MAITALHIKSDTTDGSAIFTDIGENSRNLTAVGDVQHSTDNAYLGASSISFDGSGDYIKVDNKSATNFLHNGSETYEVSGYWYLNSISSITPFASSGGYSRTFGFSIYYSANKSELRAIISSKKSVNTRYAKASWAPDINRWYYVSVKYIGNKLQLYVDDQLLAESTETYDLTTTADSDTQFKIGAFYDSAVTSTRNNWYYLNGYIQEFKITTDIGNTAVVDLEPGGGYSQDGQDVEPTGGTGTGLKINYEVTGDEVTSVEIADQGTGYTDGDELEIPGGTTNATFVLDITEEVQLTEALPEISVSESLRKFNTFAATTDANYNTIPYNRAKSFRVTNFSGKVVGIRLRSNPKLLDGFNDADFTEWTGDIQYESSELEGTGASRVRGTAYRTLTNEVMLDGSEVEFTLLMPTTSTYSFKIGVYDDPSRIGMDGAGFITLTESNSQSNTKLKVTIRLRPSESKFDVFLENPDIDMDRIHQVVDADGVFGSNNMVGSVVAIEAPNLVIDPIIYHQKVNYSVEHIGHGGSYTFPCDDNTSEYEIINLGSDAMNYSDNNQTISISGFYAR